MVFSCACKDCTHTIVWRLVDRAKEEAKANKKPGKKKSKKKKKKKKKKQQSKQQPEMPSPPHNMGKPKRIWKEAARGSNYRPAGPRVAGTALPSCRALPSCVQDVSRRDCGGAGAQGRAAAPARSSKREAKGCEAEPVPSRSGPVQPSDSGTPVRVASFVPWYSHTVHRHPSPGTSAIVTTTTTTTVVLLKYFNLPRTHGHYHRRCRRRRRSRRRRRTWRGERGMEGWWY